MSAEITIHRGHKITAQPYSRTGGSAWVELNIISADDPRGQQISVFFEGPDNAEVALSYARAINGVNRVTEPACARSK